MNNILKATTETTKLTAEVAVASSHFVYDLGKCAVQRLLPGSVSPRVQRLQAELSRGAGRFGVLALLGSGKTPAQLEVDASWAAYFMVDQAVVNRDSCAELRWIRSEDTLKDPELCEQQKLTVGAMGNLLAAYGVGVIHNSAPIILSGHRKSVDREEAWGIVSSEVANFYRYMPENAVMIGITDGDYGYRALGSPASTTTSPIERVEVGVLEGAGRSPRDNLLVGGVRLAGVLEAIEQQQLL